MNPEVIARASRRRFKATYEANIVREADACTERGALGALLRREGLYSSHLEVWRKQLRAHGVDGLAATQRGPAPKSKVSAREVVNLVVAVTTSSSGTHSRVVRRHVGRRHRARRGSLGIACHDSLRRLERNGSRDRVVGALRWKTLGRQF